MQQQPTFIPQGDPEASTPVPIQSSLELDTYQGDMIDETIKQVTHKLVQTILLSDLAFLSCKSKKSPLQQPN